jgi:hypothetical protein
MTRHGPGCRNSGRDGDIHSLARARRREKREAACKAAGAAGGPVTALAHPLRRAVTLEGLGTFIENFGNTAESPGMFKTLTNNHVSEKMNDFKGQKTASKPRTDWHPTIARRQGLVQRSAAPR